jgi:hypothetical protein
MTGKPAPQQAASQRVVSEDSRTARYAGTKTTAAIAALIVSVKTRALRVMSELKLLMSNAL